MKSNLYRLKHLTVPQRLTFAFGFLLFVLCVQSAGGYKAANKSADLVREEVVAQRTSLEASMAARTHIARLQFAIEKLRGAGDAAARSRYLTVAKQAQQGFVESLSKSLPTDAILGLAKQLQDALNKQAGGTESLAASEADALNANLDQLDGQFDAQIATQKRVLDATLETVGSLAGGALQGILISALVSVIAAVLAAWWLHRTITPALKRAVHVADVVARGDLTVELDSDEKNEMGDMIRALARMASSMRSVLQSVANSAERVMAASGEIAQGNSDLGARTEVQSSALEQTASSMNKLTSQVSQNAENARQAEQLATAASSVAFKGGEVVSKVVDTMQQINAASNEIAEIISVIDGIAFQTNILALNAAVEAARAGDQGRGFAVVAAEVRTLAVRSADAAKKIKTLIQTNVEKVGQGAGLVDEAGRTMSEVVAAIKRVNDLVSEISLASKEQAMDAAQVGKAVSHMDQTTQQNAALVEQMAAAGSSLKAQAEELVTSISVFKTGQKDRTGILATY